jgi:aminoglycoside phosphotransferase (APT) family kinase protein
LLVSFGTRRHNSCLPLKGKSLSRPWNADYPLNADRAALLIETQFPGLSPTRVASLGTGWDNAAFLVNEQYVFRFPRRHLAARLIESEIRCLPAIAPLLPLPVPLHEFVGAPTTSCPSVFAGYSFLPGKTACHLEWPDAERAENATPLAAFLSCLHRIPISAEMLKNGPKDDIRRADVKMRSERLIERLCNSVFIDCGIPVDAVIRLAEELADTPLHSGPLCWVHGDLYARHLLIDEKQHLCGVIDWGDVHLGDPALDIAIAWSFLPPDAHSLFRQAYGTSDEATWNRARFRALHYGVILTDYGREVGDEAIRKLGEQALCYAVSHS